MKNQKPFRLKVLMILMLILQACNLPSTAPGQTLTPESSPLADAQLTLTAEQQLTATFTALPSSSPTVEFTLTSALTGTPTFAYVTLSQATNCRVGASTAFPIVDTFQVGQTIQVTGKHPFDNYWYVISPNNSTVYCWMWGQYATGANLNNVPVVNPPPTYTPEPTFTSAPQPDFSLTYVNSGKCIAWWSRIRLNNTGPVAVRSISISIEDTDTGETRNSSGDGFRDVNACALTASTPSLGPGSSLTVVTPNLSADPTGHDVSVTVQLCTENGLAGSCASRTIEFTP
jgi:hypothetical protein